MHTYLNTYVLGDMKAVYHMDEETKKVGMYLLPMLDDETKSGTENRIFNDFNWEDKNQQVDSLIQVKLCGDTYMGAYAGGISLREGESVNALKYDRQTVSKDDEKITIRTFLKDARGYEAVHNLTWYRCDRSVEIYSEYTNKSGKEIKLEMLSSFSLGGLSPYLKGDGAGCLKLYRYRSVWSMEGREEVTPIEDLQLEPSWAGHGIRCERFGQAGSMPVNKFFPFAAIEDSSNGIIWGAQIAHNASWQMEVYRHDDGLALSGGLADRDLGHWMKSLVPGETLTSPKAIVSVAKGNIDVLAHRLTQAGMKHFLKAPESEQSLPVIFNEYCTTWGNPSHENITDILKAIRGKGFSYFVIDCGWFKQPDVPWDLGVGDYEISKELFPEGLDKTADAIRAEGLVPGIWFEIDNVAVKSKAFQDETHLLKKDGYTLTTTMRRFRDMRDPYVLNFLQKHVIDLLNEYGFKYIKMDYNDSIGIGCDDPDSLGEGLRLNMAASLDFIRRMKNEVQDLIVENCSSGGHKLEPLMMSVSSMASFSDAHECEEIPVIAANLHRLILPAQSQIWCVIRQTDSLKRIAYSIINTFMGRMCFSGDVTQLTNEQWRVIDEGIAFYKEITDLIKDGFTTIYGPKQLSWRHLKGYQALLRRNDDTGRAYLTFHQFTKGEGDTVISLPFEGKITKIYSDSKCQVVTEGRNIVFKGAHEDMKAIAVQLAYSHN